MKRVLRLPAYRRLLAAYSLNELAWSVGALALAVLIYRRTGSALGSTAFFLVSLVIPAFVSPFLVARLDQRAPRSILPLLYALEGVLFGVLAIMTSHFSLVAVLALALVDGIVALAARALARTATVDVLKPVELLPEGNAVTNGAFSICFMGGPAIGGVVVAAGGTVAALLANCALFAVIAVVLATATGLPGAVSEPEPSRGRLRAAIEHVRRDRAQRWLLTLQAFGMIAFTISIPVEVVLAERTLHAGASGYGAMLSTWGIGAVVGSAAYARWRRRSARMLMAMSGAALAVGFGLMASAPSLAVALAGTTLGGAGNGVQSVAARTALQEYTSQKLMALVMSLNESVAQAAPGVGILLGGVLATLANPRLALAVAGVGSLLFAVAVWVALRPSAMPPPPVEVGTIPARQPSHEPIRPTATPTSETLV